MVDRVRKRVHAAKAQGRGEEKDTSTTTTTTLKQEEEEEDMDHPPRKSSFGWRKTHAVKLSTSSKLSRTSSAATFVTAPDFQHSPVASPHKIARKPVALATPFEGESEVEYDDEEEPSFDPAVPSTIDQNLFAHHEGEVLPEVDFEDYLSRINDPITPDNASECSSIVTLTPSLASSEISITSTNLAFFPTPPKGSEKGYIPTRALSQAEKGKWKDMTDDIVRGYLTENYALTTKLDRLNARARGAGHEGFEKSCEEMMAATIRNRIGIMGVGDRVHKSIDAEVDVTATRTEGRGTSMSSGSSSSSSRLAASAKGESRPISWA